MNIFGNVGVDTGGPYQLNKVGLLKTLRTGLMVVIGSVLSFLILNIPGLDIISGTEIDTMIVTMVVVPLLEGARRWFTDYSANNGLAMGKRE